jgi:hypothetical protein
MRKVWLLAVLLAIAIPAAGQPPRQLYRTTLIQAAPGKLLELIDLLKQKFAAEQGAGEPETYWMRHSQGDQWDLLLLTPTGEYADYFATARIAKREKAYREAGVDLLRIRNAVAWQEDVFVSGPPAGDVARAFSAGGFFHVEMFIALPAKQSDLVRERGMENNYLAALARPTNFIFTRDMGAAWDAFTIGVYRDLKHYAESADLPQGKQEEAARAAGFASASAIGPYLRTLIRSHHDTLAVAIR